MARRKRKPKNTSRLALFLKVILLIVLISSLISFTAYWFLQKTAIDLDLANLDTDISEVIGTQVLEELPLDQPDQALIAQAIGEKLTDKERISLVAIYDLNLQQIWPPEGDWILLESEKAIVGLLENQIKLDSEIDDTEMDLVFNSIFNPPSETLSTLSLVRSIDKTPIAVIKSLRDYSQLFELLSRIALFCFLAVFLSCFLIFLITFGYLRGIPKHNNVKDKKADKGLTKQVSKLSDLLEQNEKLQNKLKSASSRAVVLNERFLRRVGADLHDGPAQDIGYAVLRLEQVIDQDISKELGFEFHAIKKAMDQSLNEIRAISSGLVMPELEQMTLEEGVHKVIERHQINTGTKVKDTYIDLPPDIPVPVKICAYRFAQEGLNNAFKHGKATNCKFVARLRRNVLHLSLEDNGVGFRKSELSTEGGHLGLIGLKDRIESLGGELDIDSTLGEGTTIKVAIQMNDDQ